MILVIRCVTGRESAHKVTCLVFITFCTFQLLQKLCSLVICNPRVSKWCCNSLTSLCVLSFFSKSIKIWTFSCWKMATALTKSPTTRTWIWSHPNQSTLPACAARQPPLPPVKYSNSAFPAFCPPRSFPHNMSSPALPSLSAVTLLRHDSGDSETLLEYRKCYDDIDNNK